MLVAPCMLVLAALLVTPSPQDQPVGEWPVDERWSVAEPRAVEVPERVELALEEGGGTVLIELSAPADGILHIAAACALADPHLRIVTTEPDGTPLELANEDGGGLTRAYLELAVRAGQEYDLHVTARSAEASSTEASCAVQLTSSLARETPASSALAGELRAQLESLDSEQTGAPEQVLELAQRLPTDPRAISPKLRAVAVTLSELPRRVRTVEAELAIHAVLWAYAEEHLPPLNSQRLIEMSVVAGALKYAGRPEEARPLEETALAAWTERYPEGHGNVQIARLNLAGTLYMLGELEEAAVEFRELHSTVSETAELNDPLLSAARQNLAAVELQLGYADEAAALYEEVIEAMIAAKAPILDLASARANHARAMLDLGNPEEAEADLEYVLAVFDAELPPGEPQVLQSRLDLGSALLELGDIAGARLIIERVLEQQLEKWGADHPDVLRAREQLAATLFEQRELDRARAIFDEVISVREGAHPEDRRGLLIPRLWRATILRELGQPDAALSALEDLLGALPESLADDHPLITAARANYSSALSEVGQLERARPLQEAALARLRDKLSEDHPDVQRVRNNLAWTSVRDGNPAEAVALLRASTQALLGRLARLAPVRGPREIEALAARSRFDVDEALSIASAIPQGELRSAVELKLFELVESVRTVGLVQRRAQKALARIPWDDSALLAAEEVRAAEAAVVRESRIGSDAVFEAVRRRDAAQRVLSSELTRLVGASAMPAQRSSRELANKLKPNEAAVGFWRYRRQGVDPRTGRLTPVEASYLAYVVRPGGASEGFTRVELGPADAIDTAIDRWRTEVLREGSRGVSLEVGEADLEDAERLAGTALRALLFDPLRPALGEATTLYCAPDDALFLVPFDALPGAAPGTVLGDSLRIVYCVDLTREMPTQSDTHLPSVGLLAMGGIEYDLAPAAREASAPLAAVTGAGKRQLRSRAWAPGFPFLHESESEVRDLAHSFELTHPDAQKLVLTRQDASRDTFERLAPQASFLHLATHAYFAPESIPSTRDGLAPGRGAPSAFDNREQVRGLAPMLLCGLAFAGANRAEPEADAPSALLTAAELASLDLSRCELAVLSACETNVGVRRAGQGIASLQSALYAAGANASVASLWRVPDSATKELMQRFYRALWIDGKSPEDALWEAKLAVRSRRDPQGRPLYATRDWAAWVLTEDL